ncbi:hypothetical protein D3C76_1299500 [compost metagenome]
MYFHPLTHKHRSISNPAFIEAMSIPDIANKLECFEALAEQIEHDLAHGCKVIGEYAVTVKNRVQMIDHHNRNTEPFDFKQNRGRDRANGNDPSNGIRVEQGK